MKTSTKYYILLLSAGLFALGGYFIYRHYMMPLPGTISLAGDINVKIIDAKDACPIVQNYINETKTVVKGVYLPKEVIDRIFRDRLSDPFTGVSLYIGLIPNAADATKNVYNVYMEGARVTNRVIVSDGLSTQCYYMSDTYCPVCCGWSLGDLVSRVCP